MGSTEALRTDCMGTERPSALNFLEGGLLGPAVGCLSGKERVCASFLGALTIKSPPGVSSVSVGRVSKQRRVKMQPLHFRLLVDATSFFAFFAVAASRGFPASRLVVMEVRGRTQAAKWIRERRNMRVLKQAKFGVLMSATSLFMRLMLRPQFRLWPFNSSFGGFLDLKTGVAIALLFAVCHPFRSKNPFLMACSRC
jgi:hypothetical protein